MKTVAEKNDLIIMLCLVALVFTLVIVEALLNYKIDTIITTSKEPTICVPLVNESYHGDKYYVYCMNKTEYEMEMEALRYEKMV